MKKVAILVFFCVTGSTALAADICNYEWVRLGGIQGSTATEVKKTYSNITECHNQAGGDLPELDAQAKQKVVNYYNAIDVGAICGASASSANKYLVFNEISSHRVCWRNTAVEEAAAIAAGLVKIKCCYPNPACDPAPTP